MYRVEVVNGSGEWCDTGERFRSAASARAHAHHLYFWWREVRGWRIVDGKGNIQPPAGGLTVRRLRKPEDWTERIYQGGGDQIN